jgi:hypothetical protein
MAIEPREGEEPAAEEVPVDPNAGKTVIVAGSPEHEALLNQYPNASSYGPDIVIVPAPEPEPVAEEERDLPGPNPLLTDDERGDEAGRE